MTRLLLAVAAVSLLSLPAAGYEIGSRELVRPADAPVTFRAPQLKALQSVQLDPVLEKAASTRHPLDGRVQVGFVRALPKSADVAEWVATAGGFVATLDVASPASAGIRTRLDLAGLHAPLEVRVQGADGRINVMSVDPAATREAWTPFSAGETQRVELFSRQRPEAGAVRVGAVVHFTESPLEKAAGTCTVSALCTTGDATLDAAIAQRRKSVMRINFIDGGASFLCSATLINSDKFPAAYVLTANHCIGDAASANTVTSFWNYEPVSCQDLTPNPNQTQIGGGMQLVFTNQNIDSTLMLLNGTPPAGAVYSAISTAPLTVGTAVTSLSHPAGDTMRLALGSISRNYGIIGFAQQMTGVRFTRGIIQGGSSGSGLFTLSGNQLVMRAILSGTTVREGGMSCTTTTEEGLYGSLGTFGLQMAQFLSNAPTPSDDAPNRFQDATALGALSTPINGRGILAFDNRRIDYPGDLDLYQFTLSAPAVVSAYTEGANIDTIGSILDSRGVVLGNPDDDTLAANDDANADNNHFGITRRLPAGTYYLQVGHYEPTGTGAYNLRIRADALDVNRTALYWNALESGWGINMNQQDDKLFATLFTYNANGTPVWLVMSDGRLQGDGSFQGTLYRTTGPAFNTVPWPAAGAQSTAVGTMRVVFDVVTTRLTYTFEGATVAKNIVPQRFGGALPTCEWSAFDRAFNENYQDLWWNPAENGWGVNIAHQGDLLFATLFTYDASGQPVWYVMSRGDKSGTGFSGTLYRTTGPAFNASPWTAATATAVGTMSFSFEHGNRGTMTYTVNGVTVTKQIQRQVFGALRPSCAS